MFDYRPHRFEWVRGRHATRRDATLDLVSPVRVEAFSVNYYAGLPLSHHPSLGSMATCSRIDLCPHRRAMLFGAGGGGGLWVGHTTACDFVLMIILCVMFPGSPAHICVRALARDYERHRVRYKSISLCRCHVCARCVCVCSMSRALCIWQNTSHMICVRATCVHAFIGANGAMAGRHTTGAPPRRVDYLINQARTHTHTKRHTLHTHTHTCECTTLAECESVCGAIQLQIRTHWEGPHICSILISRILVQLYTRMFVLIICISIVNIKKTQTQ